ncbi:MAG: DNA mismatch repair protein MutS, partial [Proteiniphilum sp.]|nr:DNA mismatch repair protein MutS [Proteiniphilum sp.]
YLSQVEGWISCIADIDALVSFGTYAFNNPDNVLAEVLDDDAENVIEAIDFYHPFLSHTAAVANSFTLKKGNTAIVTGANMAGKSTFLRTVGVTYVLANNGVPVCAEFFKFTPITLFSSMRTTDDLSKDISYFNAELIRLEQLIEHVKSNDFTLIILDEILKGTNSIDKLKGSIMFLEEISKYNISAVVATHDLELAKLEEKENSTYINYCFEIELSEEIKYSYKIENGVAKNLNASFLLSNILKKIQ